MSARLPMRRLWILTAVALMSCRTIGVSTTTGGYAEVSPMVANAMIVDTNQVIVIDVRRAAAYRGSGGHLPGALNVPFETIERQLSELLPYQGQTVLVYGESSTDGSVAARVLSVAGFRNVVHIDGGIRGWIEHGYGTVSGR